MAINKLSISLSQLEDPIKLKEKSSLLSIAHYNLAYECEHMQQHPEAIVNY